MTNLGNGVYSEGKKIIFDVPEMLRLANKPNSHENREHLSNELTSTAPLRYPECDINIIRSRS
tara:strand:- start:373 stop:561 length:189 start_codon:yes stop_codon:yes gene_type:complete